jgi:hypothetical protein
MKFTSLFATTAIASILTISVVPAFNANSWQASAQGVKVAQGESAQDKIDQITAMKGKPNSAVLLRKFYKDLSPIGIQPGGAGMVVNLYSKAGDVTFSLCTTFDVVVAAKKGKIAKFAASEVK